MPGRLAVKLYRLRGQDVVDDRIVAILGGVIGTYGLVLDLIGFVLFLLFVLLSSVLLIRDRGPALLH